MSLAYQYFFFNAARITIINITIVDEEGTEDERNFLGEKPEGIYVSK